MRKNRRGLPLSAMAIAVMIVVCAAVTAALYLRSLQMSRKANATTLAVIKVQDAAAVWQTAASLPEMADQLGGTLEGDAVTVAYQKEGASYTMTLTVHDASSQVPWTQIAVDGPQGRLYSADVYRNGAVSR